MYYHVVNVIGGKGPRRDQFRTCLNGVGLDAAGLVYAVGDREVKVFDSATGTLKRQWPTGRTGRCVTVDSAQQVYVGEADQIEVFDPSGRLLSCWTDSDRFGLVTSIGFTDESIIVGDATNRCIHRFNSDRRHLNDIGHDNRPPGFLIPNGQLDLCVYKGIIHTTHPGKHRVERYSADGERLGHFGHFGMRDPAHFRGCCNPTNLAVMPGGEVVVTEKAGPRVKVFDPEGKLLTVIDEEGFDPSCKNMDVAVDAERRVYVADTVRLHIRVFEPVVSVNIEDGQRAGAVEGVVEP